MASITLGGRWAANMQIYGKRDGAVLFHVDAARSSRYTNSWLALSIIPNPNPSDFKYLSNSFPSASSVVH
jgi:hypothetical protein